MKFKWFKKATPTTDAILERLAQESKEATDFPLYHTTLSFHGMPIVVADDDFTEFLAEEGYNESIELDDFYVLYQEWAAENVE
jgi:hypothetical protein